jgi:hypothetical protein
MSIPGNSGAVLHLGSTVGETLVDLRRAPTALRKSLSRARARLRIFGREIMRIPAAEFGLPIGEFEAAIAEITRGRPPAIRPHSGRDPA